MKYIIFRKNLSYDPTIGGRYSKYDGYLLISQGVIDPGIFSNQRKIRRMGSRQVYCSTAKRSKESVKDGIELEELNEIKFNLGNFVTKEEYEKYGSNLVRDKFILLFEKDLLGESRAKIKLRMDKLHNFIERLPEGKYLFISHSFFMKLFECYLTNIKLFERPETLRSYFNSEKKTYNFREGFEYEC